MLKKLTSLLQLFLLSIAVGSYSSYGQIVNGNFETLPAFTNWTVVNNGTNAWYCGALGAQAGARGAYISNNAGTTNTYTNTLGQVSHFYQDINIPAGQNTMTFNWKASGENGFDFIEVFLVPVGTAVNAGTRMGIVNRIGGPFNGQSSFQSATVNLGCYASAATMRLVFSWVNDFSLGNNPPGCIDNIVLNTSPLPVVGLTCANAVNIAGLPYNVANESTACMGNDYTAGTPGICNGTFAFGEDKVYKYVAAAAECISITLTGTSSNDIGFAVYNGCPGSGGVCVSSAGPATSNILSGSVTLPGAGTYYIVIDSQSPSTNVAYNILVTSFGAGAANDAPYQAVSMPFNIPIAGNNTCSGNADEPAAPGCFGPGGNTMNSVWFSFTAPASGCVKIRTILGTLRNTQMALFGPVLGTVAAGNGSSLGAPIFCNDDQPACGFNTYSNSIISATGLSPGFTYYIMVDGYAAQTGSFSIYLLDAGVGCTNTFPPTPGQDCASPYPVCKSSINVANPGPQAIGSICDFTSGSNCLASGERGSYFYRIAISGPGFLEFDIVPNDWAGAPSTASTDYDFAVWKTKSAGVPGPATCATLNGVAPVACNYSALGVTGCYSAANGVSPPAYPGFGGAYVARIPVVAGDEFLLNISNFSNSTSGFTVNFAGTSPIAYTPSAGGTLLWTGSLSTDWYNAENWGGCAVPNCTYNVVIPAGPVNQPLITGVTAVTGGVDINFGATLSMAAASQLKICNDYINNGSLSAVAGSTIVFQSDSVLQNQTMTGAMTGANRMQNLTINKPATAGGNTVTLNNDLDNGGNFTVGTAPTLIGGTFNAAGRYHKVAGNFNIYYSSLPYSVYNAAATLEFNGTAPQTYANRGSLNNVLMSHTSTGLTLVNSGGTDWMTIGSGTLTLNQGKIITGANRVNVLNSAAAAVTPGNATSYVEGNLKRNLLPAGGAYDYPVGTALRGYERIRYTLNNPNNLTSMQVSFSNTAIVTPMPFLGPECVTALYNQTPLNHGSWTVITVPGSATGTFSVTAYNLNYSNPQSGFSVMVKPPALAWTLQGACVPASPITAVQRTGMTTLATGAQYAIAQALTPLPIELLSFDAFPKTKSISLKWVTATEVNNKGFEIQRSINPPEFETIGWVDGNGTTNSNHEYAFEDRNVVTGPTYYYRLKQMDFDGKSDLTDVVAAKLTGKDFFVNVLPNPYSGFTNISFSLDIDSDVLIEVVNTMGQKVAVLGNGFMKKGEYHYDFSAKAIGFSKGIYTIRVFVNDETYSKRIVELD